jgi:hypothetical protein
MSQIAFDFMRMGARVKVKPTKRAPHDRTSPVLINIRRDRQGDYFDIQHSDEVDLNVLDVRRQNRHLFLMARDLRRESDREWSAFLCGRDEFHWFVAAIPESANACNVQEAKDALKPSEVWEAMRQYGVRPHERDLRRTAAFVRQGEWFFIPRPSLVVKPGEVLKNEPIRRGRGKPHICKYLFRTGGETVYVNWKYPNGLTVSQFENLPRELRNQHGWNVMVRGAKSHVRGSVQHPDHNTISLNPWHEVVMNIETQARAMEHVAFLD